VEPAGSPSWTETVQSAIAVGEYAPQADGSAFRITNRAQDLRATFDERGVAVQRRNGSGEVRIALSSWGRKEHEEVDDAPPEEGPCLTGGAVDAFGECLHRVQFARPGLTEWWENRSEGLELGFTVTAPPDGDGELVFESVTSGCVAGLLFSDGCARWVPGRDYFDGALTSRRRRKRPSHDQG